jgi:A/G-specific adenine glycosylase
MDASAETIAEPLLAWYEANARRLPWRAPPGEPPRADDADWPYRVWLSEIMLQQTTVAAVIPYFAEFTRRWPTVADLAAAPEQEVLAAWAGLGYYARARNLIACARAVHTEGLRRLPGLGAYTAAAVAAIAFGRRAVVVDANVERVVARLFAIGQPLPGGKPAIRAAAERITPSRRAGDFAQAMMDLGATVCTARAPRCGDCPLRAACAARAEGDPARYPVKPARAPRPLRTGTAWWIERDGRVWVVTRPERGMLGGMRALPDDGWNARRNGSGDPPLPGRWRLAGEVSHTFTHFHLTLKVLLYSGRDWASLAGLPGEWWPLDRLDAAGLPTLFAKAAGLAGATTAAAETRETA